MNAWVVLGGLGLVTLVAVGYFQYYVPFTQLRHALRRLAHKDYRPVVVQSRQGLFRETSGYVQRISENLQTMDQQMNDGGFSLRAILSSMMEGVFIVDRSKRIRLVNEALKKMFEIGPSPIDRTVMEVFRDHRLQGELEKTLFDGVTRRLEMSVQVSGADGITVRHLEVYAGGFHRGPQTKPFGVVVVFHDITELKNLEAVRREFVANVSHEFRTPLAIINGYVETLLDGALDDRAMAEKFLKTMASNGERLAALIEDLLTISRMEHRSDPMQFETANLREILARVEAQMEPALLKKAARLEIVWPDHAQTAAVDSTRLEQVFFNLIENALRHGGPEGTVVRVTATPAADSLTITFADNGPGIPLDDQPHIFERFYRVHKDRSRAAGGTGLGLSIVKHIVKAHGGSVRVESQPGSGAAFHVCLPLGGPKKESV